MRDERVVSRFNGNVNAGDSLDQSHSNGLGLTLANGLFSVLSSHGRGARLTVLLFHKLPHTADPLTPDEPLLAHFEHTLDFLRQHSNVLPLGEAVQALSAGTLPKKSVAITFDDGYDEWLQTVGPALRARNLPATFFVTTEQLGGPALWHERIVAAVRGLPDLGAQLPYGFGSFADLCSLDRRIALVAALTERMKYAPLPERLETVERLEAQAQSILMLPKPFDHNAVRGLHSLGFEIGAHTVSHPILNECSDEQALQEIGGCKEELEAIIGGKVSLFAYPNGRPVMDYDSRHVAMVKACGYKAAVATSNGCASIGSDMFQLPRFSPWGTTPVRIALQLARNILVKERAVSVNVPQDLQSHQRPTPVRCLLVSSTFAPMHGGSAVVYENLCLHMPQDSIRVLTAKKNYSNNQEIPDWRSHDDSVGFPIERLNLLRPLMQQRPPANILVSLYRFAFQDIPLYVRVFLAAAQIVRRHKINVVCIGELVTGSWLGIALKKVFGTRLILYIHGEEITTATGGRLHGNKRRQYLQAADKIVAVSAFTCDALTREMGIVPERITLIQNGVDVERFTPGVKSRVLSERYGLDGKKVVLTLGRLVQRKGADMAIRAMARILKVRPEVHYLIVGDGELRPELERIIVEEGVAEQVTLVGTVSEAELVEYFRLCDLFLMPNRTLADGDTEGFGLVFREANACGKPVIGGRAGGVVEAVIDGQSGYLVDGENIDEIETTVLKLLDNPALAATLGEKGLAIATASSTKAVAARFVLACERMLRLTV